ncbi:aminoacyl-histidine dipeptidase [Zobellia amurskyensis]|uniref:Cytosol non-specific dipeptidase n=1 Tax=Zobellia amurskyensis TaxID=248905 RepID=A0A7X3D1U4_9FLAO|nr:aminoacyl-histidine dipeptidase [Zobellia amurskyensis]MUH35811.1 aminoacyl-histidine dipeptidase [Zobellia amurskyensis]
MLITDLEPKTIWQHFEAINAIPRASTKEEVIINFMMAFGKSLNLETSVDAIGNVIIKKPGTKGKEDCRTIVLQGHLDMVHQKEATSNFDFETQGIEMFVDGDWVKAKETTLGADNGIGVAAIMAVLTSNDIEHPPIEALFTIDEEMGMTGAMALTKEQLQGSILLNLDSEEDDEITIGCAGGVDVAIDGPFDIKLLDAKEYSLKEIKVSGLTGGHSGMDIHLNRANAILVLTECLEYLISQTDCRLHSVDVGTLTNVIPRNGSAIIAIREDKYELFAQALKDIEQVLKQKYLNTDPDLSIEVFSSENTMGVLDVKTQKKMIEAVLTMPNGVYAMTEGIEGLVQTSNNIAIFNVGQGSYHIGCHTRSAKNAERDELVSKIRDCFPFAKVSENGPYPGWEPRPDSELLALATRCYKELNGELPAIKSIHAGLECGILSGTFPNMQMISFGPNILGAHSPEERLQISSTQKFWKLLTKLLKELK